MKYLIGFINLYYIYRYKYVLILKPVYLVTNDKKLALALLIYSRNLID